MARTRQGTGADTDKILISPDARHEQTACATQHGRHGLTRAAEQHGTDDTGMAHGPSTAGTAQADNAARHGTARRATAVRCLVGPTQRPKGMLEYGTAKTFGLHNQPIPHAPGLADTAR